jgi:hypothetical protein
VCLLVCLLFAYRDPAKKPKKKIHIFHCPITLRAVNFRFSYFAEFVSIVVVSCCWLDSCSLF